MKEIEKVLMAYANYDFRETPENIFHVFKAIENSFGPAAEHANVAKLAVEAIVAFLKENKPEKYDELLSVRKEIEISDNQEAKITLSFLLPIYAYRNGFCKKQCKFRDAREHFFTDEQLNCLECDQLSFIDMLDAIIDGDLHEQRIALLKSKELMAEPNAYLNQHNNISITPSPTLSFTDELQWHKGSPFNISYFLIADDEYFDFRDFLKKIISFTLKRFWEEAKGQDIKRIKRCESCANFFIPEKNIRKSFCSDGCYAKYETKQNKVRKRRERKRKKMN